jgi:hypothetical protein
MEDQTGEILVNFPLHISKHGVAMLANPLNNTKAINATIQIERV